MVMAELRRSVQTIAERILPEDERWVFEKAGFVFARTADDISAAARMLSDAPGETAVHRVFRNAAGQLLVETPRLLVRFKDRLKREEIFAALAELGLRPVRALTFAKNLFEVSAESGQALDATFPRASLIEYIEPEFLQQLQGRFRPTDPSYARQWQWRNTGASGGVAGADAQLEPAWDVTMGRGMRLAVIDNGMEIDHEDLQAGVQGGGYFQDDGTGSGPLVPLTAGSAFFPGGNHGTFCMGMAAARANNNRGGCGGAPESTLLPIACLVDQIGSQATLARAVAYAADPTTEDPSAAPEHGADIISCSLGPNGADWTMESVLQDAIDFATRSGRDGIGTPVFWAVSNGNYPVSRDEVCSYAGTIAVGRSSRMDLEDGSAYGPELDFLAPGVEVYSTRQGNTYGLGTGTSYATPCAAAVGALVLSVAPELKWDQLRDRLRSTCNKIGPLPYAGDECGGRNDRYGFGRINAEQAVSPPPPPERPKPKRKPRN